jgi:hypothetical protein
MAKKIQQNKSVPASHIPPLAQEGESKKRFKTSEFISVSALLVSIFAVILNKCSLDNTTKAVAISDSTFKRSIRQYELESRALLNVVDMAVDTTQLQMDLLPINYNVTNIGKYPAILQYRKVGVIFDLLFTSIDTLRKKIDRAGGWFIQSKNEMIAGNSMLSSSHYVDGMNRFQHEWFIKGRLAIYIIIDFEYKTYGFNKKYSLKFVKKITSNGDNKPLNFETTEYFETES